MGPEVSRASFGKTEERVSVIIVESFLRPRSSAETRTDQIRQGQLSDTSSKEKSRVQRNDRAGRTEVFPILVYRSVLRLSSGSQGPGGYERGQGDLRVFNPSSGATPADGPERSRRRSD